MITDTLTSPIILFFLLGMAAGFARSDLSIPEAMGKAMSIYLMVAIGLKGGVSVAESGLSAGFAAAAVAGAALSFIIPAIIFPILTRVGRLNPTDAGAVAAHYGSVSLVTFVTAKELLSGAGLAPAGFMVAVLAMMETPAIVSGLILARKHAGSRQDSGGLWHEVFLNGSVVLLVGAFIVGIIAGQEGVEPVKPVFDGGYKGILCLFLLDMGLIAARRISQSRAITMRLACLAIAIPILNGTAGVAIGTLIGLDVGTAAILGILAASASYIAVPAAMRMALPQADPGIYLSMSLGITFPFNVIFGISLFTALARTLG